jgi:hypothetical protein
MPDGRGGRVVEGAPEACGRKGQKPFEGSTKSQERFWTRAARPQGEGRDGLSQSLPLRHTLGKFSRRFGSVSGGATKRG